MKLQLAIFSPAGANFVSEIGAGRGLPESPAYIITEGGRYNSDGQNGGDESPVTPSNRTVALQPISLGGQTGLNLAIGVAALHLGLPTAPRTSVCWSISYATSCRRRQERGRNKPILAPQRDLRWE